MLILTRKAGERILIGDDIVITVIDTKGNRSRIGITAPPDKLVLREELKEKRDES